MKLLSNGNTNAFKIEILTSADISFLQHLDVGLIKGKLFS